MPSSTRLSLRGVLAIGFVGVIALMIAVGVVAVLGQQRSVQALNQLLAVDGRIAELSLKSNAAMLKARRAEKDFLLGQNEFGFEEARSRYVTFVRTGAAEIGQHMAKIRLLTGDPALIDQSLVIDLTVARYESAFLKIVDLYGRLRGRDAGLEDRMRRTAEEIETLLTHHGHNRLLVDLLGLRRSEKNFMARGLDKDVRAFADGNDRLRTDIAQIPLPSAFREPLLARTQEYGILFAQYVEIDARIDAEETVYLNAARTVEPLLEKIYIVTNQRALETQARVHKAARLTTYTVIETGLVAVLLGFGVALFVSRSLTRWTDDCLGFAERIAEGDLTTRLVPRGPTEFRILVDSLNRMAEAMSEARRHLVESAAQLREFNLALENEIAARQKTQEQLTQAQKMEAVGQLTGGLAHDFNNLLAVVIGNLDLLDEALKANPNAQELAQTALRAGLRGADLTRQLLAFSRRQTLQPEVIDLNKIVSGTADLLRRTLGETIVIKLKLADGLWPTLADLSQVESALTNLAINARDAMESGGILTIETANRPLDEYYAAENPEVAPGDYAMLAVTDTGTGMPPDVLARVFEPFFTTKGVGKGTGLGLSMVYGFAKQSNGHVKIHSEVGHGTTVQVYLPRTKNVVAVARPTATGAADAPLNAMILLVEDNPDVRKIVVKQLLELGHRVEQADNAAAALAILKKGGPIDLLFTDVVLPGGMTGTSLAHEARKLRPDIRVLLTSGFAEAAMQNSSYPHEGMELLSKPYRKADLARKILDVFRRG